MVKKSCDFVGNNLLLFAKYSLFVINIYRLIFAEKYCFVIMTVFFCWYSFFGIQKRIQTSGSFCRLIKTVGWRFVSFRVNIFQQLLKICHMTIKICHFLRIFFVKIHKLDLSNVEICHYIVNICHSCTKIRHNGYKIASNIYHLCRKICHK